MCPSCEDWSDRIVIESPTEYIRLVQQLMDLVSSGIMSEISGTIALESLAEGDGWPEDVVDQLLACATCGRRFRLGVDSVVGAGAFDVEAEDGVA